MSASHFSRGRQTEQTSQWDLLNVSIWEEQPTDSNESSEVFYVAVDAPERALRLY